MLKNRTLATQFTQVGGGGLINAGRVGRQPAHAPRITILVADFLLHLGIGEGFQEGGPDARITLVPAIKVRYVR